MNHFCANKVRQTVTQVFITYIRRASAYSLYAPHLPSSGTPDMLTEDLDKLPSSRCVCFLNQNKMLIPQNLKHVNTQHKRSTIKLTEPRPGEKQPQAGPWPTRCPLSLWGDRSVPSPPAPSRAAQLASVTRRWLCCGGVFLCLL